MDDEQFKPAPPDMGWLLTFADLVSLLITFFVLLYSMKVVDVQRWDDIKGSFSGVFSIKKPIYKVTPDSETSVEKIDLQVADNLDYLQNILTVRFKSDTVLKEAKITRNTELDTMTVTMPSTLLFDSGSSDMRALGVDAVRSLGDLMQHLDNRIEVVGHTDPAPVPQAREITNWELAMMRAIRVASLLEENGVPGPLPAVSYGDSRFFQIDQSLPFHERAALARKVEVVIYGDQEKENTPQE